MQIQSGAIDVLKDPLDGREGNQVQSGAIKFHKTYLKIRSMDEKVIKCNQVQSGAIDVLEDPFDGLEGGGEVECHLGAVLEEEGELKRIRDRQPKGGR